MYRGGVDNNTTALNTIKQEVNNVKGSVVEMNNSINNIAETKGNRKAVEIVKSSFRNEKVDILSISGKGKLIGFRLDLWLEHNNTKKSFSITVDGITIKYELPKSLSTIDRSWVSKDYMYKTSSDFTLNAFDNSGKKIEISIHEGNPCCQLSGLAIPKSENSEMSYISDSPVSFKNSFKITYEQETGSETIQAKAVAIYILE